jgi:hypothetical protein
VSLAVGVWLEPAVGEELVQAVSMATTPMDMTMLIRLARIST